MEKCYCRLGETNRIAAVTRARPMWKGRRRQCSLQRRYLGRGDLHLFDAVQCQRAWCGWSSPRASGGKKDQKKQSVGPELPSKRAKPDDAFGT